MKSWAMRFRKGLLALTFERKAFVSVLQFAFPLLFLINILGVGLFHLMAISTQLSRTCACVSAGLGVPFVFRYHRACVSSRLKYI